MLEVSNAANKLNIHLLLSFVHLLQDSCCPMCMKSVPPAQSLWRFAHQPHRHKELRGGPHSQQPPGSPQKTRELLRSLMLLKYSLVKCFEIFHML